MTRSRLRVLLVGGANTETVVIARPDFRLGGKARGHGTTEGVGGSAINWAYWLGEDRHVEAQLLCPLGDDPGGDRIRKCLTEAGVEISRLPKYSGTTSHSWIIVAGGRRSVITEGGEADAQWADHDNPNRVDKGYQNPS